MNRLKEIRQNLGLTQSQFADRLAYKYGEKWVFQRVARLESGETKLNDEIINQISDVYNIPQYALFSDLVVVPTKKDLELVSRFKNLSEQNQEAIWEMIRFKEYEEGKRE